MFRYEEISLFAFAQKKIAAFHQKIIDYPIATIQNRCKNISLVFNWAAKRSLKYNFLSILMIMAKQDRIIGMTL